MPVHEIPKVQIHTVSDRADDRHLLFLPLPALYASAFLPSAHLLDRRTTALNHAVAQAESMAEAFKACDGAMSRITELYPDAALGRDESVLELYYDDSLAAVIPAICLSSHADPLSG